MEKESSENFFLERGLCFGFPRNRAGYKDSGTDDTFKKAFQKKTKQNPEKSKWSRPGRGKPWHDPQGKTLEYTAYRRIIHPLVQRFTQYSLPSVECGLWPVGGRWMTSQVRWPPSAKGNLLGKGHLYSLELDSHRTEGWSSLVPGVFAGHLRVHYNILRSKLSFGKQDVTYKKTKVFYLLTEIKQSSLSLLCL